MQQWIWPTVGTFIFWGFAAFIPKITMKYIDPNSAIVYEALGVVALSIIVLFFLKFRLNPQPIGAMLAIMTGMLGFVGALCFLVAVSRGPVSLIAPLSALYPIVSIVLALFFLGETISIKQMAGIGFAMIAIIMIAS